MRRIEEFVWPLYIALVLCLIGLSGAEAETFGEWVLEQRGGSFMVTLSFKQSASVNNQLATSELAFICDQRHRSTSIGVILIPFDGTFESHRDPVPILIQKNSDQYDRTDVIQNWRNGNEFRFLDGKDDVAELVSLFKERDSTAEKSVHFLFPNDVDSGPPTTNHISLVFRDFLMGLEPLKRHALRLNRFKQPLDAGYVARTTMHLIVFVPHPITPQYIRRYEPLPPSTARSDQRR